MPGYRTSWQPAFTEGRVLADPEAADLLLDRWRDEERLARQAAEEAGLVVPSGTSPSFRRTALSSPATGRVLRELAARREMLAGLDLSAEADRILLRLLAEPEG